MKVLLVAVGVFAVGALAGSRVKETTGAGVAPTLSTDGVALADSEGCRVSARVTDGGTLNGGTLVSYYQDGVVGWVRASTALDCTLEANKTLDGGAPAAQVCPDLGVLAKFGRIAFAGKSLVGADGGSVTATVRTECWGRNIP